MPDKRTPDTLKRATKPIFELFTKKKPQFGINVLILLLNTYLRFYLKNKWIVSTGDISLKLLTETKRFVLNSASGGKQK